MICTGERHEERGVGNTRAITLEVDLAAGRVELRASFVLGEVKSDDLVADHVTTRGEVIGQGDLGRRTGLCNGKSVRASVDSERR